MSIRRTLPLWILAILLLTATTSRGGDSLPAFEWVDTPGEQLDLRYGDRPVVRYMYAAMDESSTAAREKTYKPYLHVFSPDGERLLTKGPGGLFPHHRGIYFGFNKITYDGGKQADTWHCTQGAYQSHQEFVAREAGADGAYLEVMIHWHGRDGVAFAKERRGMRITGAVDGVRIDFASRLEPLAVEKIHLDGDPQHAGVQFRAAQQVAEKTKDQTYYLRTDGKGEPGETRNWNHNNARDPINDETTNRPWLAMSFVVDDQRYTVLYIDHPDNPKPARYSERDYGRFGSYFVADVTQDDPLEVQYRFVIREGEMTVDECQTLRQEFVAERE